APMSLNGAGTATPVEGGFRVSGRWGYVSGCHIATHFIGIAAGPNEQKLLIVVPRAAISIVEDWDVLGMRGTGSHQVVVQDVFVPRQHTISGAFDFATSRAAAGRSVYANPMYA